MSNNEKKSSSTRHSQQNASRNTEFKVYVDTRLSCGYCGKSYNVSGFAQHFTYMCKAALEARGKDVLEVMEKKKERRRISEAKICINPHIRLERARKRWWKEIKKKGDMEDSKEVKDQFLDVPRGHFLFIEQNIVSSLSIEDRRNIFKCIKKLEDKMGKLKMEMKGNSKAQNIKNFFRSSSLVLHPDR